MQLFGVMTSREQKPSPAQFASVYVQRCRVSALAWVASNSNHTPTTSNGAANVKSICCMIPVEIGFSDSGVWGRGPGVVEHMNE